MRKQEYPAIGSKVSFIRQDHNLNVVAGTGMILAICMDAEKRLCAHIQPDNMIPDADAERPAKINVDLACLNPSPEFVELFNKRSEEVKALTAEGNGKARDIVAEYNQRIDAIKNDLLGSAIELEA